MSKLKVLLVIGLALLLVTVSSIFQNTALAAIPADAPQIFATHCAGCHIKGGNIVRRGKTLKMKALEKNQVASLDAIVQLVTNGKGNMSAYRDRLTDTEIQAVAAYVLEQAEAGWGL